MAQSLRNLVVHLIFSTKERQPFIKPDLRSDLFAYLGGIIQGMRGSVIIVNGMEDHVHMLIRIRPAQSVAEIMRVVKTNSSARAHEHGHRHFVWQAGYGAFSVSESNVKAVTKYIATKKNITRSVRSKRNLSRS
jgi:REP element-mobilizing transposase RayT